MYEPPIWRVALFLFWASARAATSIAGRSRNPPASCCAVSRDRTSRSKVSSPAQACRRKTSRSSGGRTSADCSRLSTCLQRSASIGSPVRQFSVEPRLGGAPIAHHRYRRYFEHLSRFFHAEPAKKTHFDHLH